jgi:hypothetical protein
MEKEKIIFPREKKTDISFANPSLDFERDPDYFKNLRVDNSVPRQQSPFIGIAYLLAIAKQQGIKAKFLDMVAYQLSSQDVLDYVREHQPALVGFRVLLSVIWCRFVKDGSL